MEFNYYTVDWTPLIWLSNAGNTEMVQLFLSQPNIDINCQAIRVNKPFISFLSKNFMTFLLKIIYGMEN